MNFKLILLLGIITGQAFSCKAQEAWTDKTRILPDLLRQVPVALFIQHSPNPNYPEINTTGRNKKSDYVWKHATTVCSPLQKLEIVKAGSFIWYDETGWKENVVYDKKGFKKDFKCKSGVLEKEEKFIKAWPLSKQKLNLKIIRNENINNINSAVQFCGSL